MHPLPRQPLNDVETSDSTLLVPVTHLTQAVLVATDCVGGHGIRRLGASSEVQAFSSGVLHAKRVANATRISPNSVSLANAPFDRPSLMSKSLFSVGQCQAKALFTFPSPFVVSFVAL